MEFLDDLEELNNTMHNAYLIVTKRKTLDSLYIDLNKSNKTYFSLPFDFSKTEVVIDDLIEHFSNMEDYDKCDELSKLKNVQRN
tara:strand:+ start:2609 stop:2860 length:252 start_codon:yes stop_codon:yes gene_type:complete